MFYRAGKHGHPVIVFDISPKGGTCSLEHTSIASIMYTSVPYILELPCSIFTYSPT